MSEFPIRADAVDVEQIMRQIRARIREKRGVDYTEEQIQELARVKLEKFLDPRGLRSDLLEQFRRSRPPEPDAPPAYAFEDTTLFESDKPLVRFVRAMLKPILKLFFNPNVLARVLHLQAQINRHHADLAARSAAQRAEWDALYYEVMHNLVLETTRASIEVKNMRMRVESISSRLDFNERRSRALEGVVQYRPDAGAERRGTAAGRERLPERENREPVPVPDAAGGVDPITGGDSARTRRRRRRRGRRSGPGFGEAPQGAAPESQLGAAGAATGGPPAEPPGMDDSGADEARQAEVGEHTIPAEPRLPAPAPAPQFTHHRVTDADPVPGGQSDERAQLDPREPDESPNSRES
jgi:hypothetical protein